MFVMAIIFGIVFWSHSQSCVGKAYTNVGRLRDETLLEAILEANNHIH